MKNFEAGEPLYSLDEIAKQEFVFCNGHLYHTGWFMSWQTRSLYNLAKAGKILRAKKVERRAERG